MKKLTIALLFFCMAASALAQKKEILYAGTFSVRGSEGIYVYEFDRKNGSLTLIQSINALESPTFLTIHPSGKFLYSVNRGAAEERKNAGSVSAFAIDQATGKLTLLNHKSSYGSGPCHVSADQTGKLLFISHYTGGTLTVMRLADDGSVKELSDSISYTGSSANTARQDKPHIHSAEPSSDNRFLQVADLGTDRIYAYVIDPATGKLKPAQKPYVEVKPGSGPRHFTFHPKGKYAYLAEELTSTVGVFSYNKATGALELIQDQVASLPAGFSGTNSSADIHTDPSGKYLFMSNRGHNSLAIYSIGSDGKLTLKGQQNTLGEKPRNFLVDAKNQFVFAAHQDTDNIVIFKWDAKKGQLTESGVQVKVPSPVCLKMLWLK